MQTRIVLLLAAVLAVLALAAAPVRAHAAAAAVDAADEVDDTAESELFEEDEAELEADDEAEGADEADDEAEDEFALDVEADAEADAEAEDNGVVEAADVSESPEFLEVVPAHALNTHCPKVESCPVCPGVAPVLRERETRFAAKAYRYQHGDDDAVADMTVTDTLQPAFMAGVAFADESVRKAAKAARAEYRHALALMDAHRHYKAVPKGCPPLPPKLDCRCKPFLRLAHLDATKQQAMDYAMRVRDEDESFWWSMNEAVRDAFLAGVRYNDHERAIRATANEAQPHGASDAEKLQNLQHALDAINEREQQQLQGGAK